MSEGRLTGELARRRAAALAGHTGDETSARAATADDDPGVRATGYGALARLGVATAADLATAASDADPVVRQRAAELIPGSLPPAGAHELLGPLLGDREATVVEVAAWACGEVEAADPGIVGALVDLAGGHRDALVREAAVAALGAIGDVAGLPAILKGTTDKPAVRRRAVLALAPFEGQEVDAALERALTDRDWQVRQAAEDLLSE
jgi:HEAT repeat protein